MSGGILLLNHTKLIKNPNYNESKYLLEIQPIIYSLYENEKIPYKITNLFLQSLEPSKLLFDAYSLTNYIYKKDIKTVLWQLDESSKISMIRHKYLIWNTIEPSFFPEILDSREFTCKLHITQLLPLHTSKDILDLFTEYPLFHVTIEIYKDKNKIYTLHFGSNTHHPRNANNSGVDNIELLSTWGAISGFDKKRAYSRPSIINRMKILEIPEPDILFEELLKHMKFLYSSFYYFYYYKIDSHMSGLEQVKLAIEISSK